jgi:hypothetical protein
VVPLFERMSGGGAGFDVVKVGVGAGVCMIEDERVEVCKSFEAKSRLVSRAPRCWTTCLL